MIAIPKDKIRIYDESSNAKNRFAIVLLLLLHHQFGCYEQSQLYKKPFFFDGFPLKY